MKIHHLNCGTFSPRWFSDDLDREWVCHCLLIEVEGQLVLVDTGLGTQDVQSPRERLGRLGPWLLRPHLRFDETALAQVKKLGYSPEDVGHIVLTHLDWDHAGGLSDFPQAKVHLLDLELERALQAGPLTLRYSSAQWKHNPKWLAYRTEGEPWFGFPCVRSLHGLPPEILLIPLPGHTLGHCGVALRTPQGWLLHAGDAYFHADELDFPEKVTRGLRWLRWWLAEDGEKSRQNLERLQELRRKPSEELTIFCSHSFAEWDRLRRQSQKVF